LSLPLFSCSLTPPARPNFFLNDATISHIYTLSLHDALPILLRNRQPASSSAFNAAAAQGVVRVFNQTPVPLPPKRRPCISNLRADRKSTRLNSSHQIISYAVFCLKKKKMYCSNFLRFIFTSV